LIFSIAGIFLLWSAKGTLTARIESSLNVTHSILETTEEGLVVIGDSLGTLEQIVDTLENTLLTFGGSVEDAGPLVAEIRSIIGSQLPTTLEATKTSVESAQASAEIVDNILTTITSIPFFPGEPYAPEVPLNVSLGTVAETLSEIPQSLEATDTSLGDLERNLALTQASLETLSSDIGQVRDQLGEAELVILSYQRIMRDLKERTEDLIEAVPAWINTAALILTMVLIWVFFTQIGLLLQGISMFQGPFPDVHEEPNPQANRIAEPPLEDPVPPAPEIEKN
jgi:hypothetical protein